MAAPRAFLWLMLVLLAPLFAASAQETPPPMDSVSLTLSAEDWVAAENAKVTMSIEAAFQGADAGRVRTEMRDALDKLAPGADWRFVRFDRAITASGLEQFSAIAQARLADAALDGLADKAETAGRAGFKIRLEEVSYTPTLAEIETARGALRQEIYAMASAELERVRTIYDDRDFRVASLEFYTGSAMPIEPARTRVMEAVQSAADALTGAGSVNVSHRIVLSAQLVLEARLPE